MKELLNEVEQAAKNELARANAIHPLFNSLHEAYGVLAEELDEATEALKLTEENFDMFFACVKKNNEKSVYTYLEAARNTALDCAAESIQVAAMAQKAIDSLRQNKG